jgi:hypothetical protein
MQQGAQDQGNQDDDDYPDGDLDDPPTVVADVFG